MGDLTLALKAQNMHAKVERNWLAWQTAHLVNVHIKTPVTIVKLLGEREPERRSFTPAQFGGDVAKMMAAVKAQQEADEEAELYG